MVLLEKILCLTQEELLLALELTQQAVRHLTKSLEIIQNQGKWVLRARKDFLCRTFTGIKTGSTTKTQRRENYI